MKNKTTICVLSAHYLCIWIFLLFQSNLEPLVSWSISTRLFFLLLHSLCAQTLQLFHISLSLSAPSSSNYLISSWHSHNLWLISNTFSIFLSHILLLYFLPHLLMWSHLILVYPSLLTDNWFASYTYLPSLQHISF